MFRFDARPVRQALMRIVGVLLAAGRATRFGGGKLLAPLADASFGMPPGSAMGVVAARHLVAALPDAIAVVRPGDVQLAQQLRDAGLRIVECANADAGMGASLACGVAAAKEADGWVVALADMPWILPLTIGAVAAAIAGGAKIAAPAYLGNRGHPVGFSKCHHASLVALIGDAGARSLVERHRDMLTLIAVDDAGILRDVDTPADL